MAEFPRLIAIIWQVHQRRLCRRWDDHPR